MKPTTVHNEYVAMKNFKLLSIKENNPSQKRKSLQNGKKIFIYPMYTNM